MPLEVKVLVFILALPVLVLLGMLGGLIWPD